MKLSALETAQICRGLSLLLHAGMPLGGGMFLLAREETGERKALLESMGDAMDMGGELHTAMADSGVFPALVVAMVRTGEETGNLERALAYLAAFYDNQVATARQLKQAVAYPAMMLCLMLVVIGVLLMEVLPVFDGVYAGLGSSLTGLAGVLLNIGLGLKAALPVILVLLVLLAGAVGVCVFHVPTREKVTARFLARWGDRGVLKKYNNAQFARGLAMGLGSGLPLEASMDLAAGLLSHIPGAKKRCDMCLERLLENGDLAHALGDAELLPAGESRMLALGLQGGSGDLVMEDIADRLGAEAARSLEDTVSRIEPAMVLISSLLVGVILLAVMLPLMDILSAMG